MPRSWEKWSDLGPILIHQDFGSARFGCCKAKPFAKVQRQQKIDRWYYAWGRMVETKKAHFTDLVNSKRPTRPFEEQTELQNFL